MRKNTFIYILVLLALIPSFSYSETARVTTKENAIRKKCRFFAPVRTKVQFNDILEILYPENDWLMVSYRGITGCIHKSAVREETASLSDTDRVFNPSSEAALQWKHPELDFQTVDLIENFRISQKSLEGFILSGGLNPP